MTTTQGFYDDLAEHYHFIFEDWSRSIERQAGILGPLLERYTGLSALRLLDCSCGIGTQALGLAQRGHTVVASDLSRASVARAQREARRLGVEVQFHVADMRELNSVPAEGFDAVLAADNALPHLLSEVDLSRAFEQMGSKLRRGGTLAATVRDYDQLIQTRPAMQPPAFFGAAGQRRIVHQVWDWDGTEYDLHLYISFETAVGWVSKHYISRYRALLRAEISASLERAGFTEVEWLEPQATSFYQPIVVARKEPS
ncbi:SAM-dependent methyltransferase [Granulicella aggregans]|uniref:SAM-dependent methyltransferase n=1 Tax=Granulicella aggregans TaxID=474949 RepID=A0A7W8E4S1_9BACT|nr:class I SAM-dependent methyltransferase [Granulicella aggregans]MBB5058831.1 SAM-dependent methyltransferase [Granulicella aggregans]